MKPSREYLEQIISEGKTTREIAKICNVSIYTICNYRKEYGLPEPKRKAHNAAWLVGEEFGLLTVKSRSHTGKKDRQAYWNCDCKCGGTKVINTTLLRRKAVQSCGCLNHKKGKQNKRFKGYEEISSGYIYSLKNNAKSRDIEFNITLEEMWELFLKQNRKCTLTGMEIKLVTGYRFHKAEQTASLDRIDSDKGYVIDNVQWVHKQINRMKWDLSQNEFIDWCKLVVSNQYLEKS